MATEQRPGSTVPRIGVEEEFFVVDPDRGEVVPEAATVIDRARPALGARVGGEITKLHVEARTDPCRSLDELGAQLAEGRRAVQSAASSAGLRVIASASPVLGNAVPPPITEGPRQDRGNATFRGLHDELAICAVHVHVEEPDRDRAVLIGNHLRPHLPVLLALTANSPYWCERDTGYASWRSVTWGRWPVAGPPPFLTSAQQYDEHIAMLIEAGALVDHGTIFWDLRLSANHPTLEVRVTDVPVTAAESVALAALVRALVMVAGQAVESGDEGPRPVPELLRLAYWRAARDGMGGHGVDVSTGRLLPAAALADRLVRLVRPALDEAGDRQRVEDWLARLGTDGDGATRQRAAAAARGRLTDVVDEIIAQTAPGVLAEQEGTLT
ncbi:glutamate--cysteine ligase [Micromonospora fiedleri]|uniref:Putative glutamate--cysteine ligase 2 n=1 Tax=Micromonospora fiedleri TaxID=1157498 RepID=A0ABS1UPM1_9ACTN|nr:MULTISPECIES: glutamate--cysteine ligase [Micromonospora]MBL6278296.1 glutamate--cysteine ligase [Micromonospora fiedleri]WSK41384.1 glutamate--cysteine ligase [Micromonospora maris]